MNNPPPSHATIRNDNTVLEVALATDFVFNRVLTWLRAVPDVGSQVQRLTLARRQRYWDRPPPPGDVTACLDVSLTSIFDMLALLPNLTSLNIFEVNLCRSRIPSRPLTPIPDPSFPNIKAVAIDGVHFLAMNFYPHRCTPGSPMTLLKACPGLIKLSVGHCTWALPNEVGTLEGPDPATVLPNPIPEFRFAFPRGGTCLGVDEDLYTTIRNLPDGRGTTIMELRRLGEDAKPWATCLIGEHAATLRTIRLAFTRGSDDPDYSEWDDFSLEECPRLRSVTIDFPLGDVDASVGPATSVLLKIVQGLSLRVTQCRIRLQAEANTDLASMLELMRSVPLADIAQWVVSFRPKLKVFVVARETAAEVVRQQMHELDGLGRLVVEAELVQQR